MEWTNQSQDWVFMSTARLDMRLPVYKPEHWDKMIEMDQWSNRDDPVMTCLPLGVPRQGAPARIFHTDTDITMIYRGGSDGAGGYAEFRMVPIGGPPHDPARAAQYTYMGTVGKWKATRSSDSIGFTDETWLARGGLPLRPDACRREVHPDREPACLRRDRRGSGSAGRAVGHADAEAGPGCGQYHHRRTWKLHGKRAQGSRHADEALNPTERLDGVPYCDARMA
jgi:hypothetical protein